MTTETEHTQKKVQAGLQSLHQRLEAIQAAIDEMATPEDGVALVRLLDEAVAEAERLGSLTTRLLGGEHDPRRVDALDDACAQAEEDGATA